MVDEAQGSSDAVLGDEANEDLGDGGAIFGIEAGEVVDVVGYFDEAAWGGDGSVFEVIEPERLMDTRSPNQVGLCGEPPAVCSTVAANTEVQLHVSGQGGLPSEELVSVAVNVSVIAPAADGYLRVNPNGTVGTARLQFEGGENRSMTTIAEVAEDGTITVVSTKATDVLIEVVGYYSAPEGSDGSVMVPVVPARAVKTAEGQGVCDPSPCDRMVGEESVRFKITGVGDVPVRGVAAVALTIGIEGPDMTGQAKVNKNDAENTSAANMFFQANQDVSDVVIAELDDEGYVSIYTYGADFDVVIDVTGWYQPLRGTWSYEYASDGLRTKKTSPTGDTVTTYSWDRMAPIPQLLSETTFGTSGSLTTRWSYGPGGMPIAQHNPDGTTSYIHADQLGNTRLLTDLAGDIEGTYTYDPYGKTTTHTGSRGTPLQWGGGYRDDETGFVYLRARYYQPDTGQFLTRDPLEAFTRDAYGYVGGNVLNASDPLGLFRIPGTSICVDIADPNCNSFAEQNSVGSQATANLAGGVINGMLLGHGQGALDAVGLGGHVDLESDDAQLGLYIGTGIAGVASLQYPVVFGYYSSAAGGYGIYQGCLEGPGSHPGCASAVATNAPSFILGGWAGLLGNRPGTFTSILLSLVQGNVGNSGVSYELACV